MNPIPPLTRKLLWAVLGSFVVSMLPSAVIAHLVLWPLAGLPGIGPSEGGDFLGNFMPWQWLTHLAVNSIWGLLFAAATLYFFGGQMLERWWGQRRYGLFLLACAAGATLTQWIVSSLALAAGMTANVPSSGMGGTLFGLYFACAYIAPNQEVRLLLPPIPVKILTLVIVMGVISFVSGAHDQGIFSQGGFVGGIAAAWLHIRYWRGEPPFRRNGPKPPTKPKRHLHSVN